MHTYTWPLTTYVCRFTITEQPLQYKIDLDMKVCFEDGGACFFTMAVFQDTILPKQFCITGSTFINSGLYISQGWFFFRLFNWFQLFSCEKYILKVAGHGQNRSNRTILKGGVDGVSCFSLISWILFSNQDYPWCDK